MKNTFAIVVMFMLGITGHIKGQTSGLLDPSFGNSGKVVLDLQPWDLYQDVQIQADGKIVAVGMSMNASYATRIEVSRYLSEGTPDATFGSFGHYTYNANVESGAYKCVIKDDGKILLCGYTTDYSTYNILLIQLEANGTPDLSFGNQGIVLQYLGPGESIAYDMTLQGDGKILLAGYSQDSQYNNAPFVMRLTETGLLDSSFGTGGITEIPVTQVDNDFSAVKIQSDGKILAAGHISNGLSWFSLLIARFNADGTPDLTYGTDGVVNMNLNNVDDEFFDFGITPEDETVLAGFTTTQSDYYFHLLVMKFDSNGQPVSSFGNNGKVIYGEVPYTVGNAMLLQADGKIIVTGSTGELQPANNDWALWRFNADGSPDLNFGNNGITTTDFFANADEALGVALSYDKIIVAGKTRNASNFLDFAIARYNNDFNVSIPETDRNSSFTVTPNPAKQNSGVVVTYELTQPQDIRLELLDVSGTRIMTILAGSSPAGRNTVKFSITAGTPAGFYFVRLTGTQSCNQVARLLIAE